MVELKKKYFLSKLLLPFKRIFSAKKILNSIKNNKYSLKSKGLLALRKNNNDAEKCVGCKLCAIACPVNAINIESSLTIEGIKYASIYEVDLFKCIYCGLCEEACPTDAIVQTTLQNYHFKERGQQILVKEKLLTIGNYYENKQ